MKKNVIALILMIALLSMPALAADVRFGINDIEKWDSIYLGEYGETPIEWLILDENKNSMGEDGMFLIVKNGLYKTPPSAVTYYPNSVLKDRCASLFKSFDAPEQKIVLSTYAGRINDIELNSRFWNVTDHAVENEKVFLMSTKEYNRYLNNSGYGGLDDAWYLRSNTEQWKGQMLINEDEIFSYTTGSYSISCYFRPSININSKGAAFISPADGGKENGFGLFPIEERQDVSAWKLSLLDDKREFSASADTVAYSDDRKLSIDYSGAIVDRNEYISAFLLDDKDNIFSYGALGRTISGESGSLEITLPEGLENGAYSLFVFSEQRNGDKQSDYVSTPVMLSFALEDRPSVPETGDGANPVLWSALIMISAIGMMMLRKRREA